MSMGQLSIGAQNDTGLDGLSTQTYASEVNHPEGVHLAAAGLSPQASLANVAL